jgi:very-short-patch-repair endonuclease
MKVRSEGARLLRDYLAFAESGELHSPGPALGDTLGEAESEFERAVAATIRGMGYRVVPQVGCGSFRIDMGVMAPGDDGRYLLGVECDGAQYHGAATARDRDRLRDEVLEQVYGWTLFRIWGPDWIKGRDAVVKRLSKALDDARSRSAAPPTTKSHPRASQHAEVLAPSSPPRDGGDEPPPTRAQGRDSEGPRFGFRYETAVLPTGPRAFEFHEPKAIIEHRRLLLRLVGVEGPIHFDHALACLRDAWGLKRTGNRMETAFEEAVHQLREAGFLLVRREGDERFLWPTENSPKLPRWPDNEGERRPLEWIAIEEVVEALTQIVIETCGTVPDELMRGVARYFGWQQLTEGMRDRLELAIEQAVAMGRVHRRGSDLLPAPRS